MPTRTERTESVGLPLLPHAAKVTKPSYTRLLALSVALFLIGGVSTVAFVFSRGHRASRSALPLGLVNGLDKYAGQLSMFEVQQQLSTYDVSQLIGFTGLSTQHRLAQVAGNQTKGEEVLRSLGAYKSLLVVAYGAGKPLRRSPDQPFLSLYPAGLFPVEPFNIAAEAVEKVLQRRLFPLTFTAVTFNKPAPGPPYAVYEVASGRVWLDKAVMSRLLRPQYLQQLITTSATHLGKNIAELWNKSASPRTVDAVVALATTAFGLTVSSAFSALVPLWFCIACPVVLGLALPLLINLALGELASTICREMSIPDEQCLDLWLGALLVGFVLSMASAAPIFKICKLYQCEHQAPPRPRA